MSALRLLLLTWLILGLAIACGGEPTGTTRSPIAGSSSTAIPAASSTPAPTPTPVLIQPNPGLEFDLDALQNELTHNRLRWDLMAMKRYQFDHRWICFCISELGAPVAITVRSGAIMRAAYVDSEIVTGDPDITRYHTVDGLFDIIQDAIDREAYDILAEYDAELEYPTAVSIDYDSHIADEERAFTVSNLTVIQMDSIVGHWEGVNKIAGQELTIIVDFKLTSDDLIATIDIPFRGLKGLELSGVQLDGSRVHFKLDTPEGAAVWDGVLEGEMITGKFSQADFQGTFQLIKSEIPAEAANGEPVPYTVEEVTFNNGGVKLTGTLTIPLASGPHPAAILLNGSGAQDRNAEIFGFKINQKIADRLTKSGTAVLRWDDRGVGGSGGDLRQATLEDLAGDARAAIELLRGREAIDASRIGVLGHSEGGVVALLAPKGQANIAFVILIASPAVAITELLSAQLHLILEAGGASPEQIAEQSRLQELLFQVAQSDDGWEEATEAICLSTLDAIDDLPESDRAQLGDIDDFVEIAVQNQIATVRTPAYRFFIGYDPKSDLERLTLPVLALYGGLDLQVPADQSVPPLQIALEAAGNKDFTIEVLPGANHLFQAAILGAVDEYPILDKEFIPGFLETLTNWLRIHDF